MASPEMLLRGDLVSCSVSLPSIVMTATSYGSASCMALPSKFGFIDPTPRVLATVHGKRSFISACQATGNGAMPWSSASGGRSLDVEKYRSRLETLLFCGKEIPEEKIEKPAGLPARPLAIGNKPRCTLCSARGVVECTTCTGSGLYVDSVLESQGIIVKVKCLGCGGSGSTMCPTCGDVVMLDIWKMVMNLNFAEP